ncbi:MULTISPECIES: helix-turn-helix domain-containing protein [Streptococcus]|uniref:helix-turn-helix domain-containing protein n=1 Tax=Streptococcus TaxID=1301 RepID=UPI000985A9C0|nr:MULTISPECIES: helix-turn-helix domain-containing protein [Streptococcus]MCY7243387.1 helix-turn-helix domain-containing protein [Streptococcus pasteurianus]
MAKYTYWITDEGLLLIEGWARDGLTNEQIAKNIGISRETLNQWQKRFSVISDALKSGKEVVDRQVENALFKTATGYYYDEETVTNQGEIVTVRKYSKPNTTAQIYWLKNRKRDVWTDKQEVQLEANVTTNKLDGILAQLEDDSS